VTATAAFPWEDAMAVCLGLLRWPPEAFWRASPREVAAALKLFSPSNLEPPDHAGLEALMARFPDTR
jgi:uncharacterized phage protein (TIGR02216 family)